GAAAWYTMYQNQEQARESARQYAATIDEIRQKTSAMSLPEVSDNEEKTRQALKEQNRLIDEQKSKIKSLQEKIAGYQYVLANPGWTTDNGFMINHMTSVKTVTEGLAEATNQLAVEQSRLTQMQGKAQSIQDVLAGLEERRVALIRQQAAEQNKAYQSLLIMNGQHTEFNRLLGLGNELLQQRQGLVNVPLRLPQATLDDKQQNALNNSERELALSRLKGEARERARLGYAADDLGFVGEAYKTARQNYINNSLDAWRNNQANKPKAHKKTEAEKTEDIYKRLIKQQKEQIALAGQNTELAKMKYQVSQGELSTLSEAQKKTLLHNAALIDQKKIREQLAAYESSLADSNASARASDDAQLLGYGEGSRMRERLQEMWSIRQAFEQKNNELLRQYQAGEIEEALWKQEKSLNEKYLEERLSDQQDYYAKADALRSNWNAGLQEGLTNWADSATDYASQAADAVVSTMDGLVSNISDALAGNVVGWRNWGSSILQEVSKILMNAAIVNGLKSLSKSMSGAGGWLGTVGDWLSGAVANAKGGVYTSANLSAYSNTIVDTPTYFAFAKGAGLMGEAGPEAIMPLTRAADGSLGVRAIGNVSGGGGFVYSPVYHISIQNKGSNGEIDTQSAKGLVDLIDSRVVSIMQSSRRDGGLCSA
ncbi:phage tail tape measure protein, partial [Escherichia coli]|nr:phage tail tape measure protein [Escherichia coli]EFN8692599.1 phage tail tape measure protein [Escherichia coli]